jgi:hypothetical protein
MILIVLSLDAMKNNNSERIIIEGEIKILKGILDYYESINVNTPLPNDMVSCSVVDIDKIDIYKYYKLRGEMNVLIGMLNEYNDN